jgi:hypothetical protein
LVGSVASGAHGLARLTNGIDIVMDLPSERLAGFCEELGPAFYADVGMAARAVPAGRSFNLIHLASAYKFDLFPVGNDAFGRSELARREFTAGGVTGLENIEFPVASPKIPFWPNWFGFEKEEGCQTASGAIFSG